MVEFSLGTIETILKSFCADNFLKSVKDYWLNERTDRDNEKGWVLTHHIVKCVPVSEIN